MKLRELLNEKANMGYESSEPTVTNKVTGTVSWDITPTPLKGSIDALEKATYLLEKAILESSEDEKLAKFGEVLSKLKKSLKTHLTKNYS